MELNTILKRGEEYLYNDVDNEIVMMNINTGLYVTLNDTGRSIWNSLDEPKSIDAIVNELAAAYEVSKAQCETDILDFIQLLLDRKMLVKQN
jgi:hypothetical protein